MKTNEARPLFRILSFVIAVPMWIISLLVTYSIFKNGTSEYENWQLVLSMFFGAVAFSYVAFAGYMPKFLLHLFSRGPVADDKDLK